MPLNSNDLLRQLKVARHRLGMTRFELGALLESVRDSGAWRGRATSFAEFLEAICINPSSAYQWMRIARRFLLEIGLTDKEMNALAHVNMRSMDLAARVINEDNRDDILAKLTTLHARDFREAVRSMDDEYENRRQDQVRRLVTELRDLTDDDRLAVLSAFNSRPPHPR